MPNNQPIRYFFIITLLDKSSGFQAILFSNLRLCGNVHKRHYSDPPRQLGIPGAHQGICLKHCIYVIWILENPAGMIVLPKHLNDRELIVNTEAGYLKTDCLKSALPHRL